MTPVKSHWMVAAWAGVVTARMANTAPANFLGHISSLILYMLWFLHAAGEVSKSQ
jgi:hypothetical protein